jgi:glutaminyl-tRNA synthetase
LEDKTSAAEPSKPLDFIRQIVRDELASGKHASIVTRFPPEPNGYLHIGHGKSICLNFGVAREFGGRCHMRFDDTNPAAEEQESVESILADVQWLGFHWGSHLHFTSDYFPQLHAYAVELIRRGKAFVCDLSSEEMEARRGTLTEPGIDSPFRTRAVDENLDLFARMSGGEFRPGTHTLRAMIDMRSPVLPMRDPVIYRVVDAPHHRTGTRWRVYPMYDFAHGLSDAIERITHSLCTLEFAPHRPLYEWILDALELPQPRPEQIEFARGNLSHTIVSKRHLKRLVDEGHVRGWDDPRMPTLAGLRRRGYTPESIRNFWDGVGVAKRDNVIELARLEFEIREHLNKTAPRAMAVLRPLKVILENYPAGPGEELDAINNPEDPSAGSRKVPFARELWIEREDFAEVPPKGFHRLYPGNEVRLRYAYFVKCTGVEKDAAGEITAVRCTYDPATRGGDSPDGRKVKGTLHWVSAQHAVAAEVRLYETLFTAEEPGAASGDFLADLNANSLDVIPRAWLEPSLENVAAGARVQFERIGYFCADPDSRPGAPVLNRTVGLRDTWAKVAASNARGR